MARAKNISRAEARRRARELTRAELAEGEIGEDFDATAVEAEPAASPRPTFFKLPNFRADIAALPGMFRTRRLLWLPFILILVGFVLTLLLPGLAIEVQAIALLYIQYFFFPQALFTYFVGGFLAPRAAYLIGFILGLANGLLWVVILGIGASTGLGLAGTAATDFLGAAGYVMITSVVLGTFAGGFAGWYRDFLRQMQERGKTRRADQEAKDRERRRAERSETRRAAKQRPTS